MAGLRLFNFTQQLLELSMRVRGARHEILSANVANADTPGFRPLDLDYESVMRAAMDLDDIPMSRGRQMEHLLAAPVSEGAMVYESATGDHRHGEERLDGNSVSLERQIAMVSENALAYETSLTLLSRTLARLRYVISDGRS